jgi:hypothetical protein
MARQHRSAFALYEKQVKAFEQAQGGAVQAWEMLPEGAEDDARQNLSGGITSATLRTLGHPFARLGGAAERYDPRNPARAQSRRGVGKDTAAQRSFRKTVGSMPLLPINRQSGRLLDSLERQDTKAPGALASQRVGFDRARAGNSLYVLSPEGTTRMVARGFWSAIKKNWRARNRAFRDVFVRVQRKAHS